VHFPVGGLRDRLALAAITAVRRACEGARAARAAPRRAAPRAESCRAAPRIVPHRAAPRRAAPRRAAHRASPRPPRPAVDFASGYDARPGKMTEDKYLTRILFLETVAGVPGMVASMVRHMESLRLMRRDHGWIHSLLAEAENERMHLLTFLELKRPGAPFRAAVLVAQGVFFNAFFAAYLVAPAFCHRLVGYLEEEAVHTYTRAIADLDAGHLPAWAAAPAPPIAVKYWRLAEGARLRDVLLAVRADEAIHRDANHVFASLPRDAQNPFAPSA